MGGLNGEFCAALKSLPNGSSAGPRTALVPGILGSGKRGKRPKVTEPEVTEMGLDKGRYYTRSRKVDGRVVREYVGTGEIARVAARLDTLDRQARAAERAADRELRAELEAPDEVVSAFDELAELVARAALAAAGYHQHKRGEWRKHRVRPDVAGPAGDGGEAGLPAEQAEQGQA